MTNIPCPECEGSGEDDFGTCLRCQGHGCVQEQPISELSEEELDEKIEIQKRQEGG